MTTGILILIELEEFGEFVIVNIKALAKLIARAFLNFQFEITQQLHFPIVQVQALLHLGYPG